MMAHSTESHRAIPVPMGGTGSGGWNRVEFRPERKKPEPRGFLTLLRCLLLLGLAGLEAPAQPAPALPPKLQIGLLSRGTGTANRADLLAAMKAWMQIVATERNASITPVPKIFDSVMEIENALRSGSLDFFNAPIEDVIALEKQFPLTVSLTALVQGKITEQFVLLARKDSGVTNLLMLRDETLLILDAPRTSLASTWLDAELMRKHLPLSARFFAKVIRVTKPSLAMLPVFFKQAGAAIVNRSSFITACELNPQLSQELQVVMSSEEVVPMVGVQPAGTPSEETDYYRREALRLHETPAGKNVLTLFQVDRVVGINESDLRGTRAFLAEYARLKAVAERKKPAR